jgi:transcriptional regulator with XRE-family HTH domain
MSSPKAARLRARLTQQELAALAGVSGATVSNIDRGIVPGVKIQRAVAAALKTHPEKLWPGAGP